MTLLDSADLIVVGAGFYGMTIAERAASEGFNVVVIDKRAHLGGNAYSYDDASTGIEIHKYGPHLFHTNSEQVFGYLSKFTEWDPYEHRTWSLSKGRVYPLPINLATISLFNGRAMSPMEARAWVAETAREIAEPRNLEEKAISLIGRPLYETFVKGYTLKQWRTNPSELPADIISRLPVRFNYDNRYFNDAYQCLPRNGYAAIFEKMRATRRIAVHLGVDWFALDAHRRPPTPVVYTGPIDRYFDYRFGVLGWRTIDLQLETIETEDFQGCPVMNYADAEVPWTRISEFKHFRPNRAYGGRTVIAREYQPLRRREGRSRLSDQPRRGQSPLQRLSRTRSGRKGRPLRRKARNLPLPRHASGRRRSAERLGEAFATPPRARRSPGVSRNRVRALRRLFGGAPRSH